MRLFIIFILFIAVEFIPQTFVNAYKYHTVGLFQAFMPLIITTIVSGLIFKQTIIDGHFGWTYLKLIGVSIAGLIIAKTTLFIRWYWFLSPQHRNLPGDMTEGLAFTLVFLIFGTLIVLISHLLVMSTIKSLSERPTGH